MKATAKCTTICTPKTASNSLLFLSQSDGNGNITDYIDASGTSVAHYEYGPFGGITAASGSKKDDFTHRFSTKPFDEDTGLIRYELRDYSSELGRWMSRDTIEERGGALLYGFVRNSGISLLDYLGLDAYFAGGADETKFELAAQEQSGITKSYHGDIKKVLQDKTNPKDYGPVFVGKMEVHKLANDADGDAAKQILGDKGNVFIYSHGYTDGLGVDDYAYLTPEHIRAALAERPGRRHSVKRIWALGCNFGEPGGGASQWHRMLGIDVTGHVGCGEIGLESAFGITIKGKIVNSLFGDVLTGFRSLLKKASDDEITAQEFMEGWEKEFKKQKKRGCIDKAYWHIHDSNPNYSTPKGK